MDPMEIEPAAMAYLSRQPWQGNVRELLNYVRRLAVFSNGQTINLPLIRLVDGNPGHPPPKAVTKMQKKKFWIFFQRII